MAGKKIDFSKPQTRIAVVLIVLILAEIAGWYVWVFQPRRERITTIRRNFRTKQAQLNTLLAMKPKLEDLQRQAREAQERLDSLKTIFPDQKEIPKLIKEITGIARASGIVATKFNPKPDIVKEYYVENRSDITMVGSYHALGHFFSFLANLPLIINLTDVKIQPNEDVEE